MKSLRILMKVVLFYARRLRTIWSACCPSLQTETVSHLFISRSLQCGTVQEHEGEVVPWRNICFLLGCRSNFGGQQRRGMVEGQCVCAWVFGQQKDSIVDLWLREGSLWVTDLTRVEAVHEKNEGGRWRVSLYKHHSLPKAQKIVRIHGQGEVCVAS